MITYNDIFYNRPYDDFKISDLTMVSEYITNARIYLNKQDFLDEKEHEKLSLIIFSAFSRYGRQPYTIKQMKDILEIINKKQIE